ncbi:Txe/YoeB family addiction module toxin [Brumimicrobium oceani]|uniref:Putative mRNA interferase YoeB n=1 Tax=Brumimicrobium oceani TaxID=2100725 RepID=A0A2U2XEL5_9FLAO|nr:Txe/YoeB family addiction module toxin [Brumimicrobium oceani]
MWNGDFFCWLFWSEVYVWRPKATRSCAKFRGSLGAYTGTGKPEQLKHELSGYWSRRINKEHRIVYEVFEEENKVVVLSLKGHYW